MEAIAKTLSLKLPKPGYRRLHPIIGVDYALNRWLPYMDATEVAKAARRIGTIADWVREFTILAETAERDERWLNGAFYYCAAEFYLSSANPIRAGLMDRSLRLYDEVIRDWDAERHSISHHEGFLPALVLRAKGRRLDTLVMHGGFDSYKEEFFMAAPHYADAGFDVIAFDGPGQGQALRKHGLTMSPEWESPVGSVLDYFELENCTLMGFSLGGYLAPRAAAFEKRIKRLIVDDVLFDFFAVHTAKMPPPLVSMLQSSLDANDAASVNSIVGKIVETSEMARWTFDHGVEVSGSADYFGYLGWLTKMRTATFSHKITQDVLLLGAKEDHIVPLEQFFKQAEAMTNVRSLTTQLFTRADHAHNHCHVSNTSLLIDYVAMWLRFQQRLAVGRLDLPELPDIAS
jgi:pimeloyl-ACP methyl ester carboxylesterase